MNILPKSITTSAFTIAIGAAAFMTATANSADAGPRVHFRHAVYHCYNQSSHPYRCINRVFNHTLNRAYANGYGLGYVSAYPVVNACGWEVITVKKWNPAHTRVMIAKNRVWTCY